MRLSDSLKKIFLFSLILFPPYLLASLYFLDKDSFLCPIGYANDIVIRNDGRGDGFFAAKRSGNRMHQGLDLWADIGTPVLASRSGRVIAAKQNRGMGSFVIIRHPYNITTIYGHLSKIEVEANQFVRQGQIVGRVGKTGNANFSEIQPHLHFEVRKNNIPQDPLGYLK